MGRRVDRSARQLTAEIKLSRAQIEATKASLLEADRCFPDREGGLPGFKDPARPLVDNAEAEQSFPATKAAQFESGMRHSLRDALRDVLSGMTVDDVASAIGQQRAAQYRETGAALGTKLLQDRVSQISPRDKTEGLSSELDRLRSDLDEHGDVINALHGRLGPVVIDAPSTAPPVVAGVDKAGGSSPAVNVVRALRETLMIQTARLRYMLASLDLS